MRKSYWLMKRGKRYYAEFRHLPGKRFSTGCTREKDAIEWAIDRIRKDDLSYEEIKKMTVRAFSEDMFVPGKCGWLKVQQDRGKDFTKGTINRYRRYLTKYVWPTFGRRTLSSISRAEIREFLADQTLAKDSKNKLLGTMKAMFDWAEEHGYLEKCPTDKLKYYNVKAPGATKNREHFTLEEIRKLFPEDREESIRIHGSQKWLTFRMIMADTGKRPGEVSALKWGVWKRSLHMLLIYRSTSPYSGAIQERTKSEPGVAILTPRTEGELLIYESQSEKTGADELIFVDTEGGPIRAECSNKNFKAALKRAGIERRGRSQYGLRHSFATNARSILQYQTVSKLMQHASEDMTDQYDHREIEKKLMENWTKEEINNARQSLRQILEK